MGGETETREPSQLEKKPAGDGGRKSNRTTPTDADLAADHAGRPKLTWVSAHPPAPTPMPAACTPPVVDPKYFIATDEALADMMTGTDARWVAGVVLERMHHYGGLRGFECLYPLAFVKLREHVVAVFQQPTWDWGYQRDDEILELVARASDLQRRVQALVQRYERDQLSVAAETATAYAERHTFDYVDALYARSKGGPDVLFGWYHILADVDAQELYVVDEAQAAQVAADERAEIAAVRKEIGEELVGEQVASKEVLMWWDDDVYLEDLATPEDGLEEWHQAVGWARLAESATAIVERQQRFYVYTLNHNYGFDDIWESDTFQEARTALVPAGGTIVDAIVTKDGYVVLPRNDERFFGGYQSRTASENLLATLHIAEEHGEDVDGPALCQQIAFDMLMLQLSDAESRLRKARNTLLPNYSFDPRVGEALQNRVIELRFHVLRAAELAYDASDVPTPEEQEAMQDELEEVGRITSEEPVAAAMLVNNRDTDDPDRPSESDYESRIAGMMPGDALQLAIDDIDEKLANLDKARKHFYSNPDAVWAFDELIEVARQQLPDSQQFSISYELTWRTFDAITSFYRNIIKEAALFAVGLATGHTWVGLGVWGIQTVRGAMAVQEGFEQADLIKAMSNLDFAGGLQVATPDEAASARRWAWIGLGLAVIDGFMLVRSATHMLRLSTIMNDPALAATLRYSGRPLADLAGDLGMSERRLVAELAAARGSARDELIVRIRKIQSPDPVARQAAIAKDPVASAARLRRMASSDRVREAFVELKAAFAKAAGRANSLPGLDWDVFRALVKLGYRLLQNGALTFEHFLEMIVYERLLTRRQVNAKKHEASLRSAYDEAVHMDSNGRYVEVAPSWYPVKGGCDVGCEAAAVQIQQLKGGTIHRFTGKDPALPMGGFDGSNHGWYHHEIVIKDGRVYDMATGSQGIPIEDYKKMWQYPDAIEFGF